MFKINKVEDGIILLLTVLVIGFTIFILFGDTLFSSKESIEIEGNTQRGKSLNQYDGHDKDEGGPTLSQDIFVHIGGEVLKPGVYKLREGDRLYQLVDKAGGPTPQANLDLINLVDGIRDGTKIIIPGRGSSGGESSGLVNINRATAVSLESLTGVGPATAQRIIDHRTNSGAFNSLEDLMKVSGIGDKTYENLKSQITY